jgi:hypothetical protein
MSIRRDVKTRNETFYMSAAMNETPSYVLKIAQCRVDPKIYMDMQRQDRTGPQGA